MEVVLMSTKKQGQFKDTCLKNRDIYTSKLISDGSNTILFNIE